MSADAVVYLDTSALAKWYLNEANSDAFADWMRRQEHACISSLTLAEMRCLLARRRRRREISHELEREIYATFSEDVRLGHILLRPMKDGHAMDAVHLMERLSTLPLRTLDALHLAAARDLGCDRLATADRIMARAAEALGMEAVRFD